MTVFMMSVAIVTASLATKISLCAVIYIVYNHRLGRPKWRSNRSVKTGSCTFTRETQIASIPQPASSCSSCDPQTIPGPPGLHDLAPQNLRTDRFNQRVS